MPAVPPRPSAAASLGAPPPVAVCRRPSGPRSTTGSDHHQLYRFGKRWGISRSPHAPALPAPALRLAIYPSSFRYARRGTMSVTDKRATLERPSLPRPSAAGLGIAADPCTWHGRLILASSCARLGGCCRAKARGGDEPGASRARTRMADDGGEPDEFLYKVLVVGEVSTLPKPAGFRRVERWKLRPPRR